jgi:hypothetical protein
MRRLLGWLFWGALVCLFVGAVMPKAGTPEQLKALVQREWPEVTEATMNKAAAVSGCEAGWRAHAVGDGSLITEKWGWSLGPFQVRSLWSDLGQWGRYVDGRPNRNPILLLVPSFNAQAAYDISGGGKDWGAWTCKAAT